MEQPKWLKPALVGAAVGAIALAIVGFTAGGWMTNSKAERLAASRASTETVSALVPYCVAASMADPAASAIIDELKAARSFERDDIVMDAGWATAPGADRPDRQLAVECAVKLTATS